MASAPNGAAAMDAEHAAQQLFAPLLGLGRSSNLFLENGGRLYLDVGAHPEYATAECDRLEDLLLQDRAGAMILADLAQAADEAAAKAGAQQHIHLFRNNLDAEENSCGCHENYLLHRRRDFRQVADALIAFFITRQILVGNGKIDAREDGTAHLAFSQRAEHMWDAISSATTRARPIINTRDEPLADSGSYRRMHVIVGDTNVAEPTTALKVGATQLLLQAVEDGLHIEDLALKDPMRAIREISADLNGSAPVELADGRQMSAVQIQRDIRQRIMAHIDVSDIDDLHRYVLDLWERGIDAIESGDWSSIDTELDIAIKHKLLTTYAQRLRVGLLDARVRRMDMAYHDVTLTGLAPKMEKAGLIRRLTTDEDVRRAVTQAPQTTRAHLRGRIIAAARKARADLTVDWVHARLDDQSTVPLTLNDPLAYTDQRVDDFIARIVDSTPVLPA